MKIEIDEKKFYFFNEGIVSKGNFFKPRRMTNLTQSQSYQMEDALGAFWDCHDKKNLRFTIVVEVLK